MKTKDIIVISTGFILLIIGMLFDKQIADFFIINNNNAVHNILGVLTYLGEWYIILIIMTLFFLFKRKRKLPIFWIAFLSANIITSVIKFAVARDRPLEGSLSFPSGHATAAFALLPFMFREGMKIGYAWLLLALLIVFTRLYLSQHFMTDVAAGLLIGYIISEIVLSLTGKYGKINKQLK